jgi:hypothetical protein
MQLNKRGMVYQTLAQLKVQILDALARREIFPGDDLNVHTTIDRRGHA